MNNVIKTRLTFTFPLCMIIFIFMVLAAHTIAQVGDGFPITRGPGERAFASAAFDGTNYMVAWGNRTSPGVYVTRVTLDGDVLDPDGILVATSGQLASNQSRIAFDGSNYLVVWQAGSPVNIFGARITSLGTVLDQDGFRISPSAMSDDQVSPAVAFNGTNYFIAWYRSNGEMVGSRVSREGIVLDPSGIMISSLGLPNSSPRSSISSNGDDFLTVWHKGPLGNRDVNGARVGADGKVLDSKAISIAPPDQVLPSISFDGDKYFIVWEDRREGLLETLILGARVSTQGQVLDPEGFQISTRRYEYLPFVAFDGANHFVMWTYLPDRFNEVWGSWVSPGGDVLNPESLQLSAGENNRFGRHVAFSDRNGLVLWEHCHQFPCGDSDIHGLLIPLSREVISRPKAN